MVVTAVGVLVGPLVLNDLSVRPTSSTVRTLAEATLAVVLFSDSSRVNLRALRREASMPLRLLGVGLPLTVVLGGLVAVVLFGSFSVSEALILGVILAPTDAGLGSAACESLRQLVPNRRGQTPSGDGEQTDARVPNAWGRHAAEQLTVRMRSASAVLPAFAPTPAARSQRGDVARPSLSSSR